LTVYLLAISTQGSEKMPVPFVDLGSQYQALRKEIDQSIEGVLTRSNFIMGDEVGAFEAAFAKMTGTRHAIALASGTDALSLAVQAIGIGPGDEVITVPNTWISTAFAATHAGAKVVFVDIDPDTHQIDIGAMEAAITPRTKAIIPVHLYGHPAPVDRIVEICRPQDIFVIEDVAQAPLAECGGRKVGTIGDIGCFSFYPSKNLGCYGDGGAAITNNDKMAERIRVLANYGQPERYTHTKIGWNSRLDTLQAGILLAKLDHLPEWNAMRRQHAATYDAALEGLPVKPSRAPKYGQSVFHLYVVELEQRNAAQEFLGSRGIMAQIHYPSPIHLQACYQDLNYKKGDLPIAETVMSNVLSLPMYPELTIVQIETVCAAMREFFEQS